MTPRSGSVRALQIAVLMVGLIANVYWARPYYNFDMLAYLAVAFRIGGASPELAHRRVYQIVGESVPAAEYALLTAGNEYRRVLERDADAFAQQLPGYRLKPVYPLLILLLEQLGLNPVHATVLISRAAYLLCGVMLLLWLSPVLSPGVAVASAWGVMSLPFALKLGQLSTPDALSTLVVLAALWLVYIRRQFGVGSVLLLSSLLIRPDNLLWVLVVSGMGAVWLRRRHVAAASAIVGILIYVALAHWAGYLGWATLFHHTFVELLPYPERFEPVLSPLGYIRIYLRAYHPVHLPPYYLVCVATGVPLLVHRYRRYGWSDPAVALLLAAGAFIALHGLLLPSREDRYLAPAYIVVFLLLIQTLLGERVGRAPTVSERPGTNV